ncbi:MAG TPA: pentapeptide repeat-containing protein [Streptosporangiaceae bacterium]
MVTTSAPVPKWGDPISPPQSKALSDALDEWATATKSTTPPTRRGPFDQTPLNGADVFWLMTEHWCRYTHESRPVTEGRLAAAHRAPYDEKLLEIEDGAGPLDLTGAKLDGAKLSGAWLRRAIFTRATLQKADLSGAYLTRAKLDYVDAEGAIFHVAQLDWANLGHSLLEHTHFELADLNRASLEGSYLAGGCLQGVEAYDANLRKAYLAGTRWSGARLDGIDLGGASFDPARHLNVYRHVLRKADLAQGVIDAWCVEEIKQLVDPRQVPEQLGVAWLARARFDDATVMTHMVVGDKRETIALADARYSGVSLTSIDWPCSPLADERKPTTAGPKMLVDPAWAAELEELESLIRQRLKVVRKERRWWRRAARWLQQRVDRLLHGPTTNGSVNETPPPDDPKQAADRHAVPARANRQLSVALRQQGLDRPADFYARRGYVLRQREHWANHAYLRWAGFAVLGLVAGYGFRARNILATYVLTIAAFAFGYARAGALDSTGQRVSVGPWSAIVYSITAFHGRGVGLQSLTTVGEVLSAAEAVLGLALEATIVLVVVQRLFKI